MIFFYSCYSGSARWTFLGLQRMAHLAICMISQKKHTDFHYLPFNCRFHIMHKTGYINLKTGYISFLIFLNWLSQSWNNLRAVQGYVSEILDYHTIWAVSDAILADLKMSPRKPHDRVRFFVTPKMSTFKLWLKKSLAIQSKTKTWVVWNSIDCRWSTNAQWIKNIQFLENKCSRLLFSWDRFYRNVADFREM